MDWSTFIQPLESRWLFSAPRAALSVELSNVLAEIEAVRAVLTPARSTELADRKTFLADLRPASSRANTKLVSQLERDDARGWAKTLAADASLLLKGSALCRRDTADGILLLKHPTNSALNTRASAESSALGGQVAALLSAVQDQFIAGNQSHDADLSAIVSANPSIPALPADLQSTENHLGGASGELSGTAALAQSQVNSLAADLATTAG